MKRDVNKLMELYKGEHGNPFATDSTPESIYGRQGEYFAKDDGNSGQSKDASIIDFNTSPGQLGYGEDYDGVDRWTEMQRRLKNNECQPGLWCQWIVTENGEQLEWDGGEKFYEYVEWLNYLIAHFFSKWNVMLNGEISWEGENKNDTGKIIVIDNVVTIE
jgi:hypothetical protein